MSTFAVLANEDTEYKQARSRSITAARVRAQEELGGFLDNAKNVAERRVRLATVDPDLRQIVAESAREYGFAEPDIVLAATREFLACDKTDEDCDDDDCETHKRKHSKAAPFESDDEDSDEDDDDDDKDRKPWEKKDSSAHTEHIFQPVNAVYEGLWHTAADPHWEDGYAHEREALPSSKTGLGDTGAVPTDKSKSGDQAGWNIPRIDVPSNKNKLEQQNITDRADYNNEDFDPSNPVRERVSPQKAMQPEFTQGPKTQTWTGTGGQAAPVTNQSLSSVLAKYTLVDHVG